MVTAKEFMTDEYQIKHYNTILLKPTQAAIEFAKMHVKAALEAASKSVKYNRPYIEVKDSILNAYLLENIK